MAAGRGWAHRRAGTSEGARRGEAARDPDSSQDPKLLTFLQPVPPRQRGEREGESGLHVFRGREARWGRGRNGDPRCDLLPCTVGARSGHHPAQGSSLRPHPHARPCRKRLAGHSPAPLWVRVLPSPSSVSREKARVSDAARAPPPSAAPRRPGALRLQSPHRCSPAGRTCRLPAEAPLTPPHGCAGPTRTHGLDSTAFVRRGQTLTSYCSPFNP